MVGPSLLTLLIHGGLPASPREPVATFSIAAADPATGEVGVAVASKFFAVGSVVPWARAGVGAVATQAYANTTYGPRGLDLLAAGMSPEEVVRKLTGDDPEAGRRQLGIVGALGESATYTGSGTTPWAGGRRGKSYAVQGNILAGEEVVAAMEKAFVDAPGDLADRLYAALVAGDAKGGDSRGRQSAALLVARAEGGYGGFSDRFIDIRVDDHRDPIVELGRLLDIAHLNGLWNLAWTAFTRKRHAEALPLMERTAKVAEKARSELLGEVYLDLAIIRGWAGEKAKGLEALRKAVAANPKLRKQARDDKDLEPLRAEAGYGALVGAE